MKVELNHTIVWCVDKTRSAAFLAEVLARPAPTRFGPFQVIELDNGVSLDFYERRSQSPLSTMPSSSMMRALMPCSLAYVPAVSRIGRIPESRKPTKLITMMAAAASTSQTQTDAYSKS